jgi:glycosyltransferase involved in cell wall biosynthesis
MKILYVLPGSGGSFYCGNCIRDVTVVHALRALGHEVVVIPMYLPLRSDGADIAGNSQVLYGAINVFLKQKIRFFREPRPWVERALDSPLFLKLAARTAGSVRASGLGELTLSMLQGEDGRQAGELEKLVVLLRDTVKPDVVHLSNALLLGLVKRIKEELRVPIVCFLQDEDTWINESGAGYVQPVWQMLKEKSRDVHMFIPVSRYYADLMRGQLDIPEQNMTVVPIGIELDGYEEAPLSFNPPVIGYLNRVSEASGMGILADAFIKLKEKKRIEGLRLHMSGGKTADDKPFIRDLRKKLAAHGLLKYVAFFPAFDKISRIGFFKSLSVFSVPAPGGTAFGVSLLEALASGVPVVQPSIGAYPELVQVTGGGILYEPNDADTLADAMSSMILDQAQTHEMGRRGRSSVHRYFSAQAMAEKLIEIYGKYRVRV